MRDSYASFVIYRDIYFPFCEFTERKEKYDFWKIGEEKNGMGKINVKVSEIGLEE